MNKATLTALEGSIEKWRKIVIGEGEDEGTDNCPLCAKFYDFGSCTGCPVKNRTNKSCCAASPYDKFEDALSEDITDFCDELGDYSYPKIACGPKSLQVAIYEYNFLYSLLP